MPESSATAASTTDLTESANREHSREVESVGGGGIFDWKPTYADIATSCSAEVLKRHEEDVVSSNRQCSSTGEPCLVQLEPSGP